MNDLLRVRSFAVHNLFVILLNSFRFRMQDIMVMQGLSATFNVLEL